MNLRAIITKSTLALTLVAANLVILSTADAEARGGHGARHSGPAVVRDHRTPPVVRDHRTPVVRTPVVVRDHRTPVVRTPVVVRDHRTPVVRPPVVVRDHRTPVVRTPVVRDHRTPTARPRPVYGCRYHCATNVANASGGVVVTSSRYPRRW